MSHLLLNPEDDLLIYLCEFKRYYFVEFVILNNLIFNVTSFFHQNQFSSQPPVIILKVFFFYFLIFEMRILLDTEAISSANYADVPRVL